LGCGGGTLEHINGGSEVGKTRMATCLCRNERQGLHMRETMTMVRPNKDTTTLGKLIYLEENHR
jgi:hypothetical protein